MPLKLVPPRQGKSPNYRVRGTYQGLYVDRSTKTGKRALAAKFLRQIERDIENNRFVVEGDLDFASAAIAYMKAGGERRFLTSLIRHFGNAPLRQIGQAEIDEAAAMLYPEATAATQNRQI